MESELILNDETFRDLNEQFTKIKLIVKDHKICTETEPIWEASDAKLYIDKALLNIENILTTIDTDNQNYYRILGMKYAIMYEKVKILIKIGNCEIAHALLSSISTLLKEHVLRPEITFIAFRIFNHEAYMLMKLEDLKQPQIILEYAQEVYEKVKSKSPLTDLYTVDDLFSPEVKLNSSRETANKVEKLVTNNMQILAFIYNKQGSYDQFAWLHHIVLNRQLNMRDGDPIEWAMKAARLAAYFLSKSRFREARNHLAAASHVLEVYESEIKHLELSEVPAAKLEELQHHLADVAKCWVKYGLFLFSVSKTQLVSPFYGEPNEFLRDLWVPPLFDALPSADQVEEKVIEDNQQIWKEEKSDTGTCAEHDVMEETVVKEENNLVEESVNGMPDNLHILFAKKKYTTEEKDKESNDGIQNPEPPEGQENYEEGTEKQELLFNCLDLSGIEYQVTASVIETTEQARELFLFTHAWLKRSKMFYTLKDHSMEYVNSILDLSELYRYLAFYEEDIESQYSVQKRRADALETLSAVLREVRPQCYHAVSVELLRELAEVQLEMLGLNLRRLYISPHHENSDTYQQEENSNNYSQNQFVQEPQYVQDANHVLHKMEALSDIHAKLQQFGDSFHVGEREEYEENIHLSGEPLPYFI